MSQIRYPGTFRIVLPVVLLLAGISTACNRHIARYDEHIYRELIDLKVDATDLIGRAGEPYTKHRKKADALKLQLRKLTEYVNGIPKNEVTCQMLQKVGDPDQQLLAGALKLWENQGTLSPAVIEPIRQRIAGAFDQILELERAKLR